MTLNTPATPEKRRNALQRIMRKTTQGTLYVAILGGLSMFADTLLPREFAVIAEAVLLGGFSSLLDKVITSDEDPTEEEITQVIDESRIVEIVQQNQNILVRLLKESHVLERADSEILKRLSEQTDALITVRGKLEQQATRDQVEDLRYGMYERFDMLLARSQAPNVNISASALNDPVRQLSESAALLGKLVNVPPLPPHFQAKQKDLQAVKDKLLVDASKPVIVTAPSRRAGLQGLGGIGKTVLASAIAQDCDVRRSFPDGVLWVTLGQTPNLMARQADLCRALGDPPQTFADVQQGKARLSELLREKACLLVIDDLWDLQHSRAFEAIGPRGALLITTRDERLVDALGASKHQVDVLDEEEALTLMARWLMAGDGAPPLDEQEQHAQLERLKATMPSEAKAVARECGYLPLALTLSAAQARDGIAWGTLLTELQAANLDFLDSPNGSVLASIKVSVDALKREKIARARHRYLELAIFPEDVAIPEAVIMTLWLRTKGLRPAMAEKLLVTLGKRSLLRLEGAVPDRRVYLHDLQHDYLRLALKNADAVHREFVGAYRQKCDGQWHKGPNDGYYFEHLAYHLCQAGQTAELYALLTDSPDWMETKFITCTGDSSFMADLDLALRDFADPVADPARLLILAKLHTVRQVIHARASVYSDSDLKTLVWLGRKTEALSHARLRAEAQRKFAGLLTIYEALKAKGQTDLTLLDEAGSVARAIQDDRYRASALHALAAALAQAGRFEEAGSVARAIQDDTYRAYALRDLAAALAQAGRFEEAGGVARAIQSDWSRSYALRDLAAALAQAGEVSARGVFEEAGSVARAIQSDWSRSYALRDLAAALAHAGEVSAHGVFEEAGSVARAIQDDWSRASALSALAAALAQAGEVSARGVFEEAGSVARAIQSDTARASALRDLAAALAQAGRFEEAEGVARAIQSDTARASALRALAAALAQAGRFEEAGSVARAIQDDWSRSYALRDLAAALAQAGEVSARGVFEEAGSVARAIQDDTYRVSALSDLAAALAQAGEVSARGVFEEAGSVARAIQSDTARASALSALAAALDQAGRFEEAEGVARAIQDDTYHAYALRALAAALAQAGEVSARGVFEEAGSVARAIQDDMYRASALSALAAALAQAGRFEEAGGVARAIQDDWSRASALGALAAALAQAGEVSARGVFEEAGSVARAIQDDMARASALSALAAALDQAGEVSARGVFEEAGSVARAIQDDMYRASALSALAAALAQAGRFEEAGGVARAIQSDWSRSYALRDLAAALAQAGRFEEAGSVARAIQDDWSRSYALRDLAAALAQAGEVSARGVFEEAGSVARAIQDDSSRASALRDLAAALAQAGEVSARGVFEEAGSVAHAIQDDSSRASALSALAAALDQAGRFEEAGSVARAIQSDWSRASTLRDLAAALAQAGRFEEAFSALGPRQAGEFLAEIAEWSPALDKVKQGLSVAILREAVRIIGWVRPDWRKIHELMMQP